MLLAATVHYPRYYTAQEGMLRAARRGPGDCGGWFHDTESGGGEVTDAAQPVALSDVCVVPDGEGQALFACGGAGALWFRSVAGALNRPSVVRV